MITNYRDKTKEILSICNALRDNDYPDCLLNKIKKEIKHEKVNKSDPIRKKNVTMWVYHILRVLLMQCLEFYENSILTFIPTLIKLLEIFYLN